MSTVVIATVTADRYLGRRLADGFTVGQRLIPLLCNDSRCMPPSRNRVGLRYALNLP
jgi:hypothetical protein